MTPHKLPWDILGNSGTVTQLRKATYPVSLVANADQTLVYLSLKNPLHHLGMTLRTSGERHTEGADLCRLVLRRGSLWKGAWESVITSETQAALEIHNSVPSLHLSSPPGQAPLGSFIFVLMAALDNGAAEKSQNVKTQSNSDTADAAVL